MAARGRLKNKHSEIIQLYNDGISSRKIALQYGVNKATILKLLATNNTDRRTNSNLNDNQENIVKDYLDGCRDRALLTRYGVGAAVLNKVLAASGIEKRIRGDSIRKYNVDQDYFDEIDTQSKAYYLGLFFADGYNDEKRGIIKLGLHRKDENTIRSFCRALNSERALYYEQNLLVLCFNSKYMSKRLAELGCTQGKSLTCKFPSGIDDKLLHHFIRGYFDGDGHIGDFSVRKSSRISIIGSFAFVQKIGRVFNEKCLVNVSYRKHWRTEAMWYVEVGGGLQVKRVVNYLYKEAVVYMERKKERADYLLSNKYYSP